MSKRKKHDQGAEDAPTLIDAAIAAEPHTRPSTESAGPSDEGEEATRLDVAVPEGRADEAQTTPLASASVEEVDAAVDAALGHGAPDPFDELPTIEISISAPAAGDEDASEGESWEEPTRVGAATEMAELAAQSMAEPSGGHAGEGGDGEALPVDSSARLESILESLIFASDRPLALNDLKRLVGERDSKKLAAALDTLQARHRGAGVELASTAGGWQFRTNPENAAWVAKLVAGRPARLSRAMLETLAIVAYRQPITRPEIDEIRGVDCGPVLKTLLDRTLIRMIGKKEEVGRPILYGTTPEFLRTFSLKDLTELPTLRQFHELGAAEQAKVDAEAPATAADAGGAPGAPGPASGPPRSMPAPSPLPDHDPAEEDALLSELDEASAAATRATRVPEPEQPTATVEDPTTRTQATE
jgi:segregation and condensation protein B